MDIDLPGVNGFTAMRQIKAAYPAARIIIVTSIDNAGLREAALEVDAAMYWKENLLVLRH